MGTTTTQMNSRRGCVRPGVRTGTGLVKALLAMTISLGWGVQASALPTNLSFQNDFAGWETTFNNNSMGNTSIQTASFGITPTHESKQALLTTYADDVVGGSSGSEGQGEGPVDESEIEAFLGISLNGLDAEEGSAIRQTFTTSIANQTLSFNWNFLTTDPRANDLYSDNFNDFAFVSVIGTNFSYFHILADTDSTLFPSSAGFTNFTCNELCASGSRSMQTGYRSHSITLPDVGTYTLGFGVIDVGDRLQDSALLVDVPEPSTGLFLVAGLIGLVLWRRSQVASA